MPWLMRAILAVGAVWLSTTAVEVVSPPPGVITRPEQASGAERAFDEHAAVSTPPAGRPSQDGGRFVAVLLALVGGALGLERFRRFPYPRAARVRLAPTMERARPRAPPVLVAA